MESAEKKMTDWAWFSFQGLPGNLREQCDSVILLRSKGLSICNVCCRGMAGDRNIVSFTISKEEIDKAEGIFVEFCPNNSSMPFSYYRHYNFWDKINNEEQIISRVNEILKEVFGKNVSGNWTERVIVLDVDNMYRQSESLDIVVKNGLIFGGRIGHFEIRDGSRLVLRPALFLGFWRKRQAEKYSKLYRERFGKEAFVEFSKS